MNEIFENSLYFGFFLSLVCYWIGMSIQKKIKISICNPLLIAAVIIILFLKVGNIEYQTFHQGSQYIAYLLTPATVCLALPLYRQIQVLKSSLFPVLAGLTAGAVTCLVLIIGLAYIMKMETVLVISLLPKSITTAIAIGVAEELGGISGITVMAVVVTGLFSTLIADIVFKLFRIKDPIAQGLALGASGHAIGTSKALKMGEIQGAMSSLAIVVMGIIIVVFAPLVANYI